jgi:hypothetical protein
MKAQFSIRITQEAADRQAVREAIDINAQCADRRAANGQKALVTQDSHFVVVRGRQESEALHGATFARSARAFARESRPVDCDPLKFFEARHPIGTAARKCCAPGLWPGKRRGAWSGTT